MGGLQEHTQLDMEYKNTAALMPSYQIMSYRSVVSLYCIHSTTLHYTTLHYTTLHYTTLHYITLHYITLRYTALDWMGIQSTYIATWF